ncbi:hypothetical protein RVU55_16855 [Bordetella avium]|nr:hypothetical protein [Bordetella avium]
MKPDLHPHAAIIDAHGGPKKVAERVSVERPCSIQRVWNWTRRGIPAEVRLLHPWLMAGPVAQQEGADVDSFRNLPMTISAEALVGLSVRRFQEHEVSLPTSVSAHAIEWVSGRSDAPDLPPEEAVRDS